MRFAYPEYVLDGITIHWHITNVDARLWRL